MPPGNSAKDLERTRDDYEVGKNPDDWFFFFSFFSDPDNVSDIKRAGRETKMFGLSLASLKKVFNALFSYFPI